VKRTEVHFIYTYDDSLMEPTKHCMGKGRRGGKNENVMEG
jgi:hypothetical protein